MEKKIDLRNIDPQKLDPRQGKELFRSLPDEDLADVAGGSYVQAGHVCGSFGQFEKLEDAKFDFEIGTRVQVTRSEHTWSSWSATIVDRKIESKYLARLGLRHCVRYKVHFDGWDSYYDDWYDQERLYI